MTLPNYDAWKLRSPYEEGDREPCTDPGPCSTCSGTGIIVTNRRGRYAGAGPLPDPPPAGFWESECPDCRGSGVIEGEEDA